VLVSAQRGMKKSRGDVGLTNVKTHVGGEGEEDADSRRHSDWRRESVRIVVNA
jgi:hypothetical protein